jgi:4-hydroxy-tetrahydrodipicolinate synthase
MASVNLKGTGVALITPFSANGNVDFDSLGKLIDHCISGGVEYLVSLGTTGETVNLSKEEKRDVLQFTIQHNNGRVPVVAGFGSNSTHQLIKEIEGQNLNGVSAILSVSPYYNKPSQEGIYRHYEAVAKASPLPIILYNVPGRTSSNVKAETTLRLANDFENIIGMKEASGDFSQCMTLSKHKPENFYLISGDDNITLGLIAYGFDGVISVAGQAFPYIFTEMVRLCLNGNFTEGRNLHYLLDDITDMLFAEGNPAGVKAALALQGICEEHLRLPLTSISDALREKMKLAISTLKQ